MRGIVYIQTQGKPLCNTNRVVEMQDTAVNCILMKAKTNTVLGATVHIIPEKYI